MSSSNINAQSGTKLSFISIDIDTAHLEPKDGYVFGTGRPGIGYFSLAENSSCLTDACRILQGMLVETLKNHAATIAAGRSKVCGCFAYKLSEQEKHAIETTKREMQEMESMVASLRITIDTAALPSNRSVDKCMPWWTAYVKYAYDGRVPGVTYATNKQEASLAIKTASAGTISKAIVLPVNKPPKAAKSTKPAYRSSPQLQSYPNPFLSSITYGGGDGSGSTHHCATNSWGGGGYSHCGFGGHSGGCGDGGGGGGDGGGGGGGE